MNPTTFQKLIGGRIRDLRKAAGLKQCHLAARAKLSHSFMSEVEGGKRSVSFYNAVAIANALGVDVSELFCHEHVLTLSDDLNIPANMLLKVPA